MHRSRGAARSSSKSPSESSTSSSPERAADDDTDFFAQANDSQSSIGIATYRGQNGSNEPDIIIPPIGRLPPEILISIFSKLSSSADMLHCMLVCRKWAANCVGILWHRPLCNRLDNLMRIVNSVRKNNSFFPYSELIRRLNLTALASKVTDAELLSFAECKRVDRLTLTNCFKLTDRGVSEIVEGNRHLQALDVSDLRSLTDNFLYIVAKNCPRLQGLNITGCTKITDESLVVISQSCKHLKRLKLNGVTQVTDRQITSRSVTALLSFLRNMREVCLAHCVEIDDSAFLKLPPNSLFETLRVLDLTACERIRDDAIERITDTAPRLRHLVLNKYASVQQLATLPKLKRIGLVKCQAITDWSILALARSRAAPHHIGSSCLERVHLSYCVNLTMEGIHALLNYCPRLTHLSLTGVQAFLHEDLTAFCRDAPSEFTQQQREVFCVFSGDGVVKLRDYLNRNAVPYPPETEATMYDDEDELDEEENQVAGLMSATVIRDDDDEMGDDGIIEVGPPHG
ncbi:SCF E3 ubiquitin ligase complex F-box protein grrA [Talaromyces atroroseus]|uniref:SCF E3 ubiquitin ligase complex F-box protein grrA n=1 Tax=Talaromyces atroroseus TaxID=1441469 RepID=A0A1Q5Q851_TALAT|nr:SCF E3 ubiquitin ligase complex F-box protein grrA [Talaromyces atroroseus]OKL60306.1 SCF E3 ubiquitin ligase complex F-box protein grrA [Talaromyces atroroseus]